MTESRKSTTPFYRLDALAGWRQSPVSESILQDPVLNHLRLGRPGDFPVPPNEPFGSFGGMTLPRGITINADGQVLLVDPSNDRILYFDNGECAQSTCDTRDDDVPFPFRVLWRDNRPNPTGDPALQHEIFGSSTGPNGFYDLSSPRDVLFLRNGTLAVADSGHHRVLVYSWPDLRLLREVLLGTGEPWALAEDRHQRLYVADPVRSRVVRLGRQGNVEGDFPGGRPLLQSPVAITCDGDDNVLVLDSVNAQLYLMNERGEVEALDATQARVFSRSFTVPPLQWRDEQLEYPQTLKPHCETLKLNGVRVDRQGHLQGTLLPLLSRARSIRLPRSGVYISAQLDSGILSGQWHRVVLETELPRSGRILVSTYTSDRNLDDDEVAHVEWSAPAVISTDAPNDLPELLIQSGPGRYLRLRLELLGDGYSTPLISNVLIHGPRSSSLRYLPPPFHQDPESAHFLDRFLSYFDTVQEEIRFVIQDFTRYLDPGSVPAGPFLEWLGSWFDWQFLAQWPTDLRREMLSRSIEFFRQRGTLEGLRQMLQWHTGLTDGQPRIIEHFRLRDYALLQQRRDADIHPLYVGQYPLEPAADRITHWFTVVVPASAVPDQESRDLLQRLIEAQKPAHTAFQLRVFSPGVRIGRQSSIGLDTWLGNYPEAPLGALSLGQSSTLLPPSTASPPTRAEPQGLRIGQQLLN
ncbi:phage tail protein [Nitrosomonas sp.]|uniref:phage tail protein n=1 Tax=Nitrosomonas sp. TaxID=42353 RepID=UPI003305A65B